MAGLQQSQAAVSAVQGIEKPVPLQQGIEETLHASDLWGASLQVEAALRKEQEQARSAAFKAAVAAQVQRSQMEVELRQQAAVQEQMREQARSAAFKAALAAELRRK